MRVAELTDTETVRVGERERPSANPEEVLVSVQACGVCMTDYHMYSGTFATDFPMIPGHESAGEIVAVGDDVDRYEPGQRVAINPSIPCNECRFCKTGSENLCTSLTSVGGAAENIIDGAFAEYVRVPAQNVEVLGDLTYQQAAFAEPLGCCVQGVDQLDPTSGQAAVLVGAGPIGLLLLQLLRLEGAGPIVVSEPMAERRELALELGADHAVNPLSEDLEKEINEHTDNVDLAVEAVGRPETIEQAMDLVGPSGQTLVFGVPPEDTTVKVSPFDIFYNELELVGSYSLTPGTFQRAIALLENGRVEVDTLVTHEWELDELQDAFDRMDNQDGLKQIVYPNE